MDNRPPALHRWWVYQRERFPVFAHGILIGSFSVSTVGYTSSLLNMDSLRTAALVVSFVLCFLFFLQLRIADEFKDYEDDRRYRPERPVPRGLVTLRELGLLAIVAGLVQLVVALVFERSLALMLMIAWAYYLLMTVEFFVPAWLSTRPIAYMISHLFILPLLALLVSACVWLPHRGTPPELGWYLAFSYGSGAVLELGRKVRAPMDERAGVRTYSALWGGRRAVLAWLGAMFFSALCGTLAAKTIGFHIPMATLLALSVLWAGSIAWRFVSAPSTASANRLAAYSGLWVLAMYVSVGVAPMCWRWYVTGAESIP